MKKEATFLKSLTRNYVERIHFKQFDDEDGVPQSYVVVAHKALAL